MGSVNISAYESSPDKRVVQVDEVKISVAPDGAHRYVAWGGASLKDGSFVRYRQQRAIELVSHCRIDKLLSPKTDRTTRAMVKC